MMQEVEVLKTIPELVCSYFSEEQFTLSAVRDFLETPGNLWYAMYNCTNAVSAECFLFY